MTPERLRGQLGTAATTRERERERERRFGLAVKRQAGKQKDLVSIPLRLPSLSSKVVVFVHCFVTLSTQ